MRSGFTAELDDSFNEYTYGTSLTWALIETLGGPQELLSAPLVPSLPAEAELGFDLSLEYYWGLLCLQFKIPQRLVNRNAGQANVMGVPYYRFPVKTDLTRNGKCQHNTLCDLETELGPEGGVVRYCAPAFHTSGQLWHHMQHDSLASNSAMASPLRLGAVTPGDRHYYAYTNPRDVRCFSEPGQEFAATLEALLADLGLTNRPPRRLGEFMAACEARFINAFDGDLPTAGEDAGQRLAFMGAGMGLQFIIVGSPGENSQQAARNG